MGRLLTIPATGFARPGDRQRTLTGSGIKVGPISVQFILIIALTLLGLFYLVQSNRVSTGSLQLKSLDAQKSQINEENERLSVEAARLQSIQQIKRSAEEVKAAAKAAGSAPKATADKASTDAASSGNVRPAHEPGEQAG